MEQKVNPIAETLKNTLASPNECDRNGEIANVVDGLFAIARALNNVASAIRESRPQLKEQESREERQSKPLRAYSMSDICTLEE